MKKMKIVLCTDSICNPPKCPIVDIQEDRVLIGEKNNICVLTRQQFEIFKQKIIAGII